MADRPSIPTCAIILTHSRPELLDECVRAIHPQVDQVIVIDNASDPPAAPPWPESLDGRESAPLIVIRDPGRPANLSRLWRVGLEEAGGVERPGGPWGVAILCDDAIAPPGWVAAVATGIELGYAAACTHASAKSLAAPIIKREPDSDIHNRMTGWAFMLDGQRAHPGLNGVWPDERLEWWWGDTHLDWLARRAAGMAIMPGPVVPNARPNEYTVGRPELGQRAGLDGKEFEAIWGWRPW